MLVGALALGHVCCCLSVWILVLTQLHGDAAGALWASGLWPLSYTPFCRRCLRVFSNPTQSLLLDYDRNAEISS